MSTEMKEIFRSEDPSQDKETAPFIDIGQGLYSLEIDNPYDNTSWRRYTLFGYLSVNHILVISILFINNFKLSLILSSFNLLITIYFIVRIFIRCFANHHDSNIDNDDDLKTFHYTAPVIKQYDFPAASYINTVSNDASVSKCDRMRRIFYALNTIICDVFHMDADAIRLSFCPKNIGVLVMFFTIFLNLYYFCIIVLYSAPFCARSWTKAFVSRECHETNVVYLSFYLHDVYPILLGIMISYSVTNLCVMSVDTKDKLAHVKSKILQHFERDNINSIENRVQCEIKKKVLDRLRVKWWLFAIFPIIWALAVLSGVNGIKRYPVVMTCVSFIAAVYVYVLVHSLRKLLVIATYPQIILRVFTEPVYCNNANDILKWAQLRHYYKEYDIPIKIGNISFICGIYFMITFIVTFVISIVILNGPNGNDHGMALYSQCSILVALIITILVVFNSLSEAYHITQRQIGMLKKEKLRLQVAVQGVKEDEKLKIFNVIDLVIDGILKYDKPFTILSMPMTQNTLLAIRGIVVSLIGIFIAQLLSS